MTGFRIPTTGLHTLIQMNIVDYHNMDSKTVYTPVEISLIHGSDYDVDKLSIMRKSMYKGKAVGYAPDGSFNYNAPTHADTKERIAYLKNVMYQSLVDAITDVKDLDVLEHMLSPISMDLIKAFALSKESKTPLNVLLPTGKLKMVEAVGIGRTATGIFANAAKVQAYLNNISLPTPVSLKLNDRVIDYPSKISIKFGKNLALIDGFINTSIDNLKELSLTKMRINHNSIEIAAAMLVLGEESLDNIYDFIDIY
jgi:hypothetical protein